MNRSEKVKKKKTSHVKSSLQVSTPTSTLGIPAKNLDMYASIFARDKESSSSSSDEEVSQVETPTATATFKKSSAVSRITEAKHINDSKNISFDRDKSSSKSIVAPTNVSTSKNSKNSITDVRKAKAVTKESISIESDSEEESKDFVFDNGDDEESEPEIIGVGIKNKILAAKKRTELEIKEEIESDMEIKHEVESELGDGDIEEVPEEDPNRTAIRQELSSLTFEELEALKQKLGSKVYNEAMFGKKKGGREKKKHVVYKRDNKNRPRELPARVHVPKVRQVAVPLKKKVHRDPRFEDSAGDLDKKIWEQNYEFLKEIQHTEAEELQKKLKTEHNEEKRSTIRDYLQVLKNKERSDAVNAKEMQKRKQAKDENIKRLKEGKKPFYMKKSTKKYLDLAEKYEQLKSTGKLEQYLTKKRKKNAVRDKKALKIAVR